MKYTSSFIKNPTLLILFSSILIFLVQCRAENETPNYAQSLTYLAIGGAQCTNVNDCFDRFVRTADEGASLLVVDKNNRIIHEREQGTIANNRHQIIFSGSKWVTAVIIQRAIQSGSCNTGGALSLNSTTGQVLGWTSRNNITMRQLLAFTSGLNDRGGASGQDTCIANLPNNATNAQKDECVNSIRDNTKQDPAGETFVYNSNHMAVAQRMTEVSCGKSWSQLYTR
jgi:CubicO group peptidase (beta-lactamase class C family)